MAAPAAQLPQHVIYIGDSERNAHFPPNRSTSSMTIYLKLLLHVLWTETNNFFTIYFLIMGVLQCLKKMTTSTASGTFFPLALYVLLTYVMQAVDLSRVHKSTGIIDKTLFDAYRDGRHIELRSKDMMPGDILLITDQKPVPCDCLLLSTTQINIFVDTSMIDGETDVKDRFPISFPPTVIPATITQSHSVITATSPQSGTREVSGSITIGGSIQRSRQQSTELGTELLSTQELEASDEPAEGRTSQYQITSDSLTSSFTTDNFVERGSIIRSSGTNYFVALYTGKDCRSAAVQSEFVSKISVIDGYIEKISVFAFLIQFLIAIVNGLLGYYYPARIAKYSTTSVSGGWQCIILIVRNYLLLTFMIPITLKIIIPLFRLIYGLFITWDRQFIDSSTQIGAQALSTTITENLGALDVIVADKTGTLTKNQLKLISVVEGENKFGDVPKAATILEDEALKTKLKSDNDPDFVMFWKALSICHSVRISNEQELFGSSSDELAIVKALIQLGFEFKSPQPNVVNVDSPFGSYRYEILKIIPFNRKRMKMIVVAKDSNGVYVFMKGAPEKVVRKCVTHSGSTASMFDQYQQKGYRTLSVSYKQIDTFDPAAPIAELESFHRLLGTLGIEDALQDDVQLSIEVLQQAQLKIWMATGDAEKNTIVAASMLKLLKPSDNIIDLTATFLYEKLKGFCEGCKKVPEASFSVLVNCEDSEAVAHGLESKEFVESLLRARCVIFYRCKPITKAQVAYYLRIHGKRVLSVGDGANDTQLLRAADVGVGIIGAGGTRGFDSCDFAVPSFRNLCRLILVHGHTSLHRSVLAVHFSFYKAFLFAFCQAIYQIWTGFSAQSFFGSFCLTTYNIVWTFIPMIAILFDKDISENFLYQLSFLYKKLQNNLSICWGNITWMIVAFYQSITTMLIAYGMTGEAFFKDSTGEDLGKDYLALLVYFALVIIVTFYMLYQLNTLTYYSIVAIFGNIILMVSISALAQSDVFSFNNRDWVGFYGECFNTSGALIIMFTIVFVAVTPSWLGLTIWSQFNATEPLLVIEKETLASKSDTPLFFTRKKSQKSEGK